ncbi:hypothetical protein ABIB27_000140 [Arthrobacter sp. UYEF21]
MHEQRSRSPASTHNGPGRTSKPKGPESGVMPSSGPSWSGVGVGVCCQRTVRHDVRPQHPYGLIFAPPADVQSILPPWKVWVQL